jgi:drug/metabolite transporter (DMT)-like permease
MSLKVRLLLAFFSIYVVWGSTYLAILLAVETIPPLATAGVRHLLGLSYLIVFGSVVAFSAYIWLLERCPATLVATHTYVNPVIAVLLGWLFAGERLTPRVIGATGLILSAVLLLKSSTAQRRTQSGEGMCPPQDARADRAGA